MANEKEVKPKVEVSIGQIKEDLKLGIDRAGIMEKYGLRRVDVMNIFKHPSLKGLKVHKARTGTGKSKATIGFVLVDESGNDITSEAVSATPVARTHKDATETNTSDVQPVAENAPVATPVSQGEGW